MAGLRLQAYGAKRRLSANTAPRAKPCASRRQNLLIYCFNLKAFVVGSGYVSWILVRSAGDEACSLVVTSHCLTLAPAWAIEEASGALIEPAPFAGQSTGPAEGVEKPSKDFEARLTHHCTQQDTSCLVGFELATS